MALPLLLGPWAVALFLLFQITSYILRKRRQTIKSQELGCEPVPTYTPGDPFGIYSFFETIKAAKGDKLPEYLVERIDSVSKRENRLVTTFWNTTAGAANIFTCEPRNVQAILAKQFKDFGFGDIRNGSFRPLLGHGIFASDGKLWEHSRAMLRPQFIRDQINDLELEETHVCNMIKAIPVTSTGWTDVVDMQPLFFRLTIDAATEFLFGESVNSQLATLSGDAAGRGVLRNCDEKVFTNAFDKAQAYIFRAGTMGRFFRLGQTPDFWRKVKEVHEFVDYYVQLSLNKDLRAKTLEEGSNVKQKYVFLEAIAETTKDPVELRDQLLNILLAGRDTTASLLSWVFFLLTKEDIFQRLRQAVINDFGTYENPNDISFMRLKSCSYLQNTIKEALRLYAVVPVNRRTAAIDTTLPVGGGPDGKSPIFVPKDTEVYYSVHVMHKRKDLWGDDAEEFRPERWEGKKYGWEYLPFNGGPRICLGQQFALTEAGYVIVRLLQKFDKLEAVDADVHPGYRMTLTCAPAEGVKLRLREAKGR